jgi:3',5'-cyclic AMP phosphodiesterase CpdA
VAEPGAPVRDFVDTNRNLAEAITMLNTMTPRPDVVLATGDLVDEGRADQYEILGELLDQLAVPLYLLAGNHDEVEPLVAVLGADHPYLPRSGPLQYVVEDHDVRIVALDSTRPAHHDGVLDDERLSWLHATLATRPDTPTLVALHHPPFDTGIWWLDCAGLKGADRLEAIVRAHPQVRRVAAGHIHRPIQTTWGEVLVTVSPATAHQVAFDLVPESAPVLTAEPPMLTMFDWRGDTVVSHVVPFAGDVPTHEIVPDLERWQLGVEFLRARPPMPKTRPPEPQDS